MLGPKLFIFLICDLDDGREDLDFSTFADDTNLKRVADMLEAWFATWGNLDRLEDWAERKDMKQSEAQIPVCKEPHACVQKLFFHHAHELIWICA